MEMSKIQMNGTNYEIKSLIGFSNLAKFLYDLSINQKELEKKIYGDHHQSLSLNMIKEGKDISQKSSSVTNQIKYPENNLITENNKNELYQQNNFQNDDYFSIEKGATNQEILSKIIKNDKDID